MGVNVSSMKSDLDERQKALDAYKERARQLELIKERFEKLKAKLGHLATRRRALRLRPRDSQEGRQGHPGQGRRHHQSRPAARGARLPGRRRSCNEHTPRSHGRASRASRPHLRCDRGRPTAARRHTTHGSCGFERAGGRAVGVSCPRRSTGSIRAPSPWPRRAAGPHTPGRRRPCQRSSCTRPAATTARTSPSPSSRRRSCRTSSTRSRHSRRGPRQSRRTSRGLRPASPARPPPGAGLGKQCNVAEQPPSRRMTTRRAMPTSCAHRSTRDVGHYGILAGNPIRTGVS
jgi:hypothetical protein